MADEEISVALNTAGYEGPLSKLTTAMNTFNTASVMATAQQKQMAKVMTDLGSIYSSYAKILVQTAKATALAVEGPSEALNKKFQNAQRVLANMDRELQKLQATGEKISNIPLVPKDLTRTGKAFGDAFERVFKNIEQRVTGMREKVVEEINKAREAAATTTITTATGAVVTTGQSDVAAATAEKEAAMAEYAAKLNAMKINADYEKSLAGVTARREKESQAIIAAADAELAAEVDRYNTQVALMAKNEAASAKYWAKQEKDAQKALEAEAAAVKAEAVAEFNAAENAMEINGQRIKIIEKMADTEEKAAEKIQSAAAKEIAAEVAKYNKQVEGLAKTEAEANNYFRVLEREKQLIDALRATYGKQIAALPTVQQAELNEKLEKFAKDVAAGDLTLTAFEKKLQAVSTDEKGIIDTTDSLTRQFIKFDDTLTKVTGKTGFADAIKKGIIELESAFKGVTGVDVTKLNPRQQQIMRDAFEAAARSANKLGVEVTDLTKIWAQYQQGTLRVDANNREMVNILNEVSAAHERAGMAVDKHTRQWQRFGQLIAARALTAAFYNFTNAVRSNIQTTLELSKALGEIQTVSHDMPLIYEDWRDAVRELSDEYNILQTDVAEGLYQAISNQIGQGQQAITFMHTAGSFAKATVSSMEDSINLLSSALNAFQMPVTAANRVAAELFKTIELGRVRATDMADTLGRSAVLAHQASISFEEYLSMIQQFTISGVRFSQASTFIINVINKLMKPSEELKRLFKEWGVSSGQAAIQMYGLSGVVRKLLEETGGDLGELSEYIKDIRGTTGFAGLMSNIDAVESNIRETLKSTADYFQAIQETTTTTGHILTMEANKVRNELMAQMMTVEDLLAKANKLFSIVNMSMGDLGSAVLPSMTEGLVVVTATRLIAQAFAVESAIPKAIWRIGGFITIIWTLSRLLDEFAKNLDSMSGVIEKGKKDAEVAAINLSKINDQLVRDIQEMNREKIQELTKTQELEKAVIEKGLVQARDGAKEMIQIQQQARESQRDELKKRITDLEQANKDAEKYIDDLTRKYEEQRIEERKSSPFATPFERFDITMTGAQQLFGQSMQQLAMAGTKEELQQASALFDSYMKQMTDARRIAQSDLGNLEPVEIDQERDVRFRQFVAAYRARQQEIAQTELPQLRDQLNAINREVKSYAEASKEVNTQLEKNIENEQHLIDLLKIKVGLRATELIMAGETGDAIKTAIAYNKQMGDLEQRQIKERTKITESELEAQRSLFEAFTLPESFKNMIGQMRGLATMIAGEDQNAPIVQQVNQLERNIEAMRQEFLATETSPEARMEILRTTVPSVVRQATTLGTTLEKQAIGGTALGEEQTQEMLKTLKDILGALVEQQGYVESGKYALAIASANDRQAMQEGSGAQQATQKGMIDAFRTQAASEQAGYPGFPVPGGARGGLVMHNGGWVPHLARGGDVPAYLQAGEFVVDKETAAGWTEWQDWLRGFGLPPFPGQDFDAAYAYDNVQKQYQAMAARDAELRAQWSSKQREMNVAGADPTAIKAMKADLKQQMASNVVYGPNGPLDLNTMGAAINALNNVPEMQQAYWNRRAQQLQNQYGSYKEQITPQITNLEADTLDKQRQFRELQKQYNRDINSGMATMSRADFKRQLHGYQAGIVANQDRIAELNWLQTRLPNMKSPVDLMNERIAAEAAATGAAQPKAEEADYEMYNGRKIFSAAGIKKFGQPMMGLAKVDTEAKKISESFLGASKLEWFKEAVDPRRTWFGAFRPDTWSRKDVTLNALGLLGGTAAILAGSAAAALIAGAGGTTLGLTRVSSIPQLLGYGSKAPQIEAFMSMGAEGTNLASLSWLKNGAMWLPRLIKAHPWFSAYAAYKLGPRVYTALTKYLETGELPKFTFGTPEHLAKGGFPGVPRGTDTIPAWLTPGEFVVNANASARYRGLLEQLNSFGGTTRPNFISPQYKQGGGSIGETKIYYNNNVTINHPTGNPALDATRIVQEINRQQSRGTARVRTR